jgi:hypothetical protein
MLYKDLIDILKYNYFINWQKYLYHLYQVASFTAWLNQAYATSKTCPNCFQNLTNDLNLKKDKKLNGIMIFLEEIAVALERRLRWGVLSHWFWYFALVGRSSGGSDGIIDSSGQNYRCWRWSRVLHLRQKFFKFRLKSIEVLIVPRFFLRRCHSNSPCSKVI